MKKIIIRISRLLLLTAACLSVSACDDLRVYGSVGYSSYNGGYHGGGYGTSVRIGGRIY